MTSALDTAAASEVSGRGTAGHSFAAIAAGKHARVQFRHLLAFNRRQFSADMLVMSRLHVRNDSARTKQRTAP